MSVYHRILVPLDASDLTDRVLDTALGTAAWSGAEVVLLHVLPNSATLKGGDATTKALDEIEQQIDGLLAQAAARSGSAPMPDRSKVRAEVRSGDVIEAIASAVEELMIDLVVMGSHGRSGLMEQVTGSTTEQIIAKVPASVFVVRPVGYPYLRD